jgi:hypothetical protein
MKERIKELAEQTGYIWHTSGEPQIYEFTPEKLEKFAELIVKECVSKIENEAAQYAEPVWAFELINDIKEHFGVKE